MSALVNREEALRNLLQALDSKDNEKITHAKYNFLFEAADLLGIVVNYVALAEYGIFFDYGKSIIKKGTRFYRIRRYSDKIDFSNPREWTPPPTYPQNRANHQGQKALYLGSTETICILETHIKKGESYVLGVYECIEDFEVGGFFSLDPNNQLHNLAGVVLNAFFIAPARNQYNRELFEYLDKYYGKITINDFSSLKNTILDANYGKELSYKFGVLNQKNRLYNLTNKISDILAYSAPSGIRYSSCYIPVETIGIYCLEYNLVLYESAIKKMKFLSCEIKRIDDNDCPELTDVNITKIYLEGRL